MQALSPEVVASLITSFADFAFMMGFAAGALFAATVSSFIRRLMDIQHDDESRG